ncbi:hypothetical protein TBR22_A27260 [Luteitalea sp. TBR-22]|uniref:hypothetical protein n=1 Tax=Luteitalea sp. TBR-22 TaxID=2802971 RepID=UPI001AF2EF29|nr:hypothetical protein [Luteitalea sp. TBR-22]BCS33499.1 hypothetical protein TBR22_A27260 [Luteitalea sp. TBR-22]
MTFALLRVAAGPRLGHGHLRRAEVLARALGRPCVVSIRGRGAPDLTLPTIAGGAAGAILDAVRPRVLVLDDPRERASRPWCVAARRRSVPVVSMHDLGLGPLPSDLAVDGSIVCRGRLPARRVLRGPAYATVAARPARRGDQVRRVLVSLGGGPRAALTRRIASTLTRRWPSLDVIATGGSGPADGFAWVAAPAGLSPWMAQVDVAVVGGGVTLYEAVGSGVPAIGVAVVAAQRPTIRGFAARGLALDGGLAAGGRDVVPSVCRAMTRLLADAPWRRRVAIEGPRLIDGRGADRVARAIRDLAEGRGRA